MRFTFQQTYIWNGINNDPDPKMIKVTIKVKPGHGEEQARKKLPMPDLGRKWIRVV